MGRGRVHRVCGAGGGGGGGGGVGGGERGVVVGVRVGFAAVSALAAEEMSVELVKAPVVVTATAVSGSSSTHGDGKLEPFLSSPRPIGVSVCRGALTLSRPR